ncbi:MAG TPA: PEGA domain-containing protein [Methanomicrobiales archaeon]|nr:PEGA domain-containing protein [Methanomicrobiales archaeon]
MRRVPSAAILLSVLLVTALLAAGCTKEAPQAGSLLVTSTPPGLEVQVILDGNYRGHTPLTLTNLSAGYHLLQLRSEGYAERVETINLNGGQDLHLSADYPPIPTPTPTPQPTLPVAPNTTAPTLLPTSIPTLPVPLGALYITSFPAGATIYLDGKGYGITPRLIENLTPKTYELRLSLVGWDDYKIVLSVSPGLTNREDATLHPQS